MQVNASFDLCSRLNTYLHWLAATCIDLRALWTCSKVFASWQTLFQYLCNQYMWVSCVIIIEPAFSLVSHYIYNSCLWPPFCNRVVQFKLNKANSAWLQHKLMQVASWCSNETQVLASWLALTCVLVWTGPKITCNGGLKADRLETFCSIAVMLRSNVLWVMFRVRTRQVNGNNGR